MPSDAVPPSPPAPGGLPPPRAERAFLGLTGPTWLAVFGFWTMMAVLDTVKTSVAPNHAQPQPLLRMLFEQFQWWWMWLPFTPLVFALARRFPVAAGSAAKTARNLLLHVAFSLPVAGVKTVAGAFGFWFVVVAPEHGAPFAPVAHNFVRLFLMSSVVVYWAMVVTASAVDYYRLLRDRELEAARLAVRAAQLETTVTEARLNALRMELNPHFLFNSLNSVAGLVRRRDSDKAVEVLATLGELLRVTLGQKEQEVPLEMEMDFLRRYLQIERVRYHDRLTVEEDVPAALLSVPVPSLVLQPLVENAVRHGIARRPGPGTIVVRAAREGGDVVLEVRDTGAGVEPVVRGHGVGLTNTRERLARLYGDRASLRLEDAPGGGTRAIVRLPAPREGDAYAMGASGRNPGSRPGA